MRKNVIIIAILALFGAVLPSAFADGGPSLQDAMALDREGKSAEAIAMIQEIMKQKSDAENIEGHLSLGLVYFKMKKYDEALGEFDRTIAIKKESPMAYYFKGLIYEKKALGQADGKMARDMQKKALESWQDYLKYAGTARRKPELHKHIGRSIEDAVRRANQHVSILKEKLGHE